MSVFRKVADGRYSMPAWQLYGLEMHDLAETRAGVSMPASEWFCGLGGELSCQAIAALSDMAGWACALTLQRPGISVVLLDSDTRFLRSVRPDGRRLRSDMTATEVAPDLFVMRGEMRNADGHLVALA